MVEPFTCLTTKILRYCIVHFALLWFFFHHWFPHTSMCRLLAWQSILCKWWKQISTTAPADLIRLSKQFNKNIILFSLNRRSSLFYDWKKNDRDLFLPLLLVLGLMPLQNGAILSLTHFLNNHVIYLFIWCCLCFPGEVYYVHLLLIKSPGHSSSVLWEWVIAIASVGVVLVMHTGLAEDCYQHKQITHVLSRSWDCKFCIFLHLSCATMDMLRLEKYSFLIDSGCLVCWSG